MTDAATPGGSPGPSSDDPHALLDVLREYVEYLRSDVAAVVNSLNNRLNAILGAVREIPLNGLEPAARRELEQVRREAERATVITAGLLHRIEETAPTSAPRAAPIHPLERSRPAHVLVVEDDPANRSVATRLLQRAGHLVTACEDGLEALEVLELGGIDCVICDVRMPSLSGRGLFEQVEERLPDVMRRFVFVTGDFSQPGTREFLDRTRQPVLAKPYEAAELLAAVATIVRNAGLRTGAGDPP